MIRRNVQRRWKIAAVLFVGVTAFAGALEAPVFTITLGATLVAAVIIGKAFIDLIEW
tara:strand:- start:186 stop:356 length:171 start_codon:yes stop_codon:yes gene_type:complete